MITFLIALPIAIAVVLIARRVAALRRMRDLTLSPGWIVRHQD
jgi:hypothetical protein